ncbi:MAG: methionyl-tRNA formyltransferase [Gemmatimonadaceae bacterium]
MRVLFWGTPEFAAAPLRALVGEGFEVTGVVTQPDKPQGRSRTLTPPPVKQIALEESLPVYQPRSPKDDEFFDAIQRMAPDISVVVAYGHILPRRIVDLPRMGTLNIHASLLPALRGAAPIQAAIRQGFTETGVTIMRMVPALDAGPIILPSATPILDDETYGELQNRLSELGALTLLESLALMELGGITEQPQDDSKATYAPKVTRTDALVDWNLTAGEVARAIRAYDPKPGAFTTIHGADVKLFGPVVMSIDSIAGLPNIPEAGDVVSVENGMTVMCADTLLRIQDVQPSGKTRMPSAQWARGRGVGVGDKFGA